MNKWILFPAGFATGFAALAWLPSLLAGSPAKNAHRQTEPDPGYLAALAATSRPGNPGVPAGSAMETAAIAAVTNLFTNYTADALRVNIRKVYADEVYFRDAFRQFGRAEEIETYMLKGLEPVRSCTFEFEKVAAAGGDYYLPWTMVVSFQSDPAGVVNRTMGVSRMRFNAEGRVVFHQDYWDPTDLVWSRIPVASPLIRWVKGRL